MGAIERYYPNRVREEKKVLRASPKIRYHNCDRFGHFKDECTSRELYLLVLEEVEEKMIIMHERGGR